jgi:hypothetical protein
VVRKAVIKVRVKIKARPIPTNHHHHLHLRMQVIIKEMKLWLNIPSTFEPPGILAQADE